MPTRPAALAAAVGCLIMATACGGGGTSSATQTTSPSQSSASPTAVVSPPVAPPSHVDNGTTLRSPAAGKSAVVEIPHPTGSGYLKATLVGVTKGSWKDIPGHDPDNPDNDKLTPYYVTFEFTNVGGTGIRRGRVNAATQLQVVSRHEGLMLATSDKLMSDKQMEHFGPCTRPAGDSEIKIEPGQTLRECRAFATENYEPPLAAVILPTLDINAANINVTWMLRKQ
ncbi:hypothetical protein [Streptomyces sp. NPDC005408]|uniref:hypothetical protein n=1 Tax=Streptomyces sp. NPDC005408 TaxID=3155341 RepID=UPI0033A23162